MSTKKQTRQLESPAGTSTARAPTTITMITPKHGNMPDQRARRGWLLKNGNPPGNPNAAPRCGDAQRDSMRRAGHADQWPVSHARRCQYWTADQADPKPHTEGKKSTLLQEPNKTSNLRRGGVQRVYSCDRGTTQNYEVRG